MINLGCDSHTKNKESQVVSDWSTLTIISDEYMVIRIENDDDSSIVRYYNAGSIFTGRPKKIKMDTLKTCFTTAEKDSIFILVKEMISNPSKSKRACTDFAGDLKLTIDYGGVFKEPGTCEQSIEYSGVCNWVELSDNTIRLNKILKRKITWLSK